MSSYKYTTYLLHLLSSTITQQLQHNFLLLLLLFLGIQKINFFLSSYCSAFLLEKMMSFSKATIVLAIFLILVGVFGQVKVEATRVLPEDFAAANHLESYSSVYEKAKSAMGCWLERLASGPSPKGPGH
ncbi:hypothetical protein MANES_11G128100v8 [Manihot esculenta]|uniref:Uncharacterized protein n=1 Tax=Manihot esculenta TaxID=3983 RepID=A0A2C9V1Z9_MANES|nr:hypothetical protein MANES_11G128100v8 [Manihot esculenta]